MTELNSDTPPVILTDGNKLSELIEKAFGDEKIRRLFDGLDKPTPANISHCISVLVKGIEEIITECGQGALKKQYVIEAFKELEEHYNLDKKLDEMVDFVALLSPLSIYGVVVGTAVELVDEQMFGIILDWTIEGAVSMMKIK